jgi:hypothetical protein
MNRMHGRSTAFFNPKWVGLRIGWNGDFSKIENASNLIIDSKWIS